MFSSVLVLMSRQHRHHVAADPRPGKGRVLVGGVVAERQAGGRGELPRLIPAERQQRPDDPPAPRRKAEQRPPPGARGEAVEHGLGEVGARVAGGDPVEAAGGAQRLGGGVAGIAGGGLDVAVREVGSLDGELDAELLAEGACGGLVLAGVGAEPVVEVQARRRDRAPTAATRAAARQAESGPPETIATPDEPSGTRPLSRTASASSERGSFGEAVVTSAPTGCTLRARPDAKSVP